MTIQHFSRLSPEFVERLLDNLGLAVIVTDLKGVTLYWNKYATELYGWKADEVIGRSIYEITVPSTSTRRAAEIMASLAQGDAWQGEFQVKNRSGETFTAEVRNVPILDGQGRLEAIIGLSSDVTERVVLEAERKRLAGELEMASRAKDEFLGLVSHELRTPITTILGFADILTRRKINDPEIVQDALKDILESARRLERIVSDLLALAKAENGRDAVLAEPVSLPAVIEAVIDQHRRQYPERVIDYKPAGVPPVAGQRVYVEHILQNLLGNAEKYSPETQPIEISLESRPTGVVVTVSDRGIGLKAEEINDLFENFYRSDRVAGIQGAGLGLSVCRRLVEAQRGRIWAEEREGGGASFAFCLRVMGVEEQVGTTS